MFIVQMQDIEGRWFDTSASPEKNLSSAKPWAERRWIKNQAKLHLRKCGVRVIERTETVVWEAGQ